MTTSAALSRKQKALDERWAPEKVAFFEKHALLWNDGRIKISNYVEGYKQTRKGVMPKWYADPLGLKVLPDKAQIFEKVGYRPSDPACRFHASLKKIKVFSGGAGAGKSLAAAMDALPIIMTPGTVTYLIAPNYSIGQFEFDYIWGALNHDVWGGFFHDMAQSENGGRYTNQAGNGKMQIKLYWPEYKQHSLVEVKTAKNEDAILGVSLDMAILCEGSKLKKTLIDNKLRMRIFRGGGIMLAPSTPSGMGWMSDWYTKGIANHKLYFATNADTRMNPTYVNKTSFQDLKDLTEDMDDYDFNEQVGGKPMSRFGNVFKDFDPNIHCDWDPSWPKPSWPVCRGIDFGYTDPFVCLWVAFDEDWRAYVFGELYETKMLIDDAVRGIAEFEGLKVTEPTPQVPWIKVRGPGSKVNVTLPTVVDWDAGDRANLTRSGITPQRMAVKDISVGLKAVNGGLRLAGDGRPRIYIKADSCPELIREVSMLEWGEGDSKPKLGQSDHACLDGETLIATPEGALRIEELQGENLRVLALDRQGRVVVARAAGGMTKQKAPVVKVRFGDGSEVVATRDHPFLVEGGIRGVLLGESLVALPVRGFANVTGPWQASDSTSEETRLALAMARTSGSWLRREVVAVEGVGSRPVYNLVVPGFGNYLLANGLVSSNCDALRYVIKTLTRGSCNPQIQSVTAGP